MQCFWLNAKNSMLRAHRGNANLLMVGWFLMFNACLHAHNCDFLTIIRSTAEADGKMRSFFTVFTE